MSTRPPILHAEVISSIRSGFRPVTPIGRGSRQPRAEPPCTVSDSPLERSPCGSCQKLWGPHGQPNPRYLWNHIAHHPMHPIYLVIRAPEQNRTSRITSERQNVTQPLPNRAGPRHRRSACLRCGWSIGKRAGFIQCTRRPRLATSAGQKFVQLLTKQERFGSSGRHAERNASKGVVDSLPHGVEPCTRGACAARFMA